MIRIFKQGVIPILFLVFSISRIFATSSLSGQVNHYAKVLEINGCVITVDTSDSFQKGDYVLLLQMKAGEIQKTNNHSYGKVTNLANAGNYQQNEVIYVEEDKIYLKHSITEAFTPSLGVQIVGIRPHQSIFVSNVKVKPWNGEKGGVLYLKAPTAINIRSNLNADKTGFRGGLRSLSNNTCSILEYEIDYNSANAGQKGEGYVPSLPYNAGRGALASAGGGGNSFNAGGAGGGLLGKGGCGGDSFSELDNTSCTRKRIGGIGGHAITLEQVQDRILLGSGGGGGHQNPDPNCTEEATDGGNGGGIIIITSKEITFKDGITLSAKGETPNENAIRDGAGGGGSGGTILIDGETIEGEITIDVSGGDGGNVNNKLYSTECHGPGGGGGGGIIQYSVASFTSTMTVNGGKSGKIINDNSPCYNSNYGATKGSIGTINNVFTLNESSEICGQYLIEARDDYYSGKSPVAFTVKPKENDSYSSPVSFQILTPFSQGPQLQVQKDELTFNYKQYQIEETTFDYEICLTQAPYLCDTATIHIRIDYENTPPVAINDTINIPTGVIRKLLPLFNDFDPDGDPIKFQSPALSELYKAIMEEELLEIKVPKPGTYKIPYEICDNQGACDQGLIIIISDESLDIEIPEGYSPNDDNINDYFEIVNLEYQDQVMVKIYNRWGQVVFKDDFYQNNWDGTGPNGDDLPDGTYFYNVTPLNKETKTGYVIIHR